MYGETPVGPADTAPGRGLSPHVRGNPCTRRRRERRPRSIPACTGKPQCGPSSGDRDTVYPRMYGETERMTVLPWQRRGLSPHVRGNRLRRGRPPTRYGSIPACTGKPCHPIRRGKSEMVYPRMYGETRVLALQQIVHQGLSPHVRGNPECPYNAPMASGSIPACTGKPSAARSTSPWLAVYPRMYGETQCAGLSERRRAGLSPHVRGNHLRGEVGQGSPRSIPACTGKPLPRSDLHAMSRVYPRMYGETSQPRTSPPCWQGLSPHVRGNRIAGKAS